MYKVIFKDLSDIITLVPSILSETFFGTRKGRPKMSSSSSPPDPSPDQDEEETVEYLTGKLQYNRIDFSIFHK